MSRTVDIRPYIGSDNLRIDGRTIPYPLVNSRDYLMAKHPEMTDEEYDTWQDANSEQNQMLNAIIAMKQSCFLLRNTEYSCGSLSDSLYQHKEEMVAAYNKKYPNEPFDEDFYENYRNIISVQHEHVREIDISDMKNPAGVIYYDTLDFPGKYVVRMMDAIVENVEVSNAVVVKDTLHECHVDLQDAGFFIGRPAITSDVHIVEIWLRP